MRVETLTFLCLVCPHDEPRTVAQKHKSLSRRRRRFFNRDAGASDTHETLEAMHVSGVGGSKIEFWDGVRALWSGHRVGAKPRETKLHLRAATHRRGAFCVTHTDKLTAVQDIPSGECGTRSRQNDADVWRKEKDTHKLDGEVRLAKRVGGARSTMLWDHGTWAHAIHDHM